MQLKSSYYKNILLEYDLIKYTVLHHTSRQILKKNRRYAQGWASQVALMVKNQPANAGDI